MITLMIILLIVIVIIITHTNYTDHSTDNSNDHDNTTIWSYVLGDIAKGGLTKVQHTRYLIKDF